VSAVQRAHRRRRLQRRDDKNCFSWPSAPAFINIHCCLRSSRVLPVCNRGTASAQLPLACSHLPLMQDLSDGLEAPKTWKATCLRQFDAATMLPVMANCAIVTGRNSSVLISLPLRNSRKNEEMRVTDAIFSVFNKPLFISRGTGVLLQVPGWISIRNCSRTCSLSWRCPRRLK
jgi:hypothetical protein